MNIMCKNCKYFIFVFMVSMLLYIILSPLMMLGVVQAAIVSCLIFQSFTIIILNRLCCKCSSLLLFIVIIMGASVIDVFIRICCFENTMMSFPVSIGEKLSIVAGYVVYKTMKKG